MDSSNRIVDSNNIKYPDVKMHKKTKNAKLSEKQMYAKKAKSPSSIAKKVKSPSGMAKKVKSSSGTPNKIKSPSSTSKKVKLPSGTIKNEKLNKENGIKNEQRSRKIYKKTGNLTLSPKKQRPIKMSPRVRSL